MIRYLVHTDGRTVETDRLDPSWLQPGSGCMVWADVIEPTEADGLVLQQAFGVHALAVEDALQALHHPKIESYGSLVYAVLHGIRFQPEAHAFETQDTDFFLSAQSLVTVHDGRRRSVALISALALRNPMVLGEGPAALMHRIIDTMVSHYAPEVDALEARLDAIEMQVLASPDDGLMTDILGVKRDIAALRRVVIPQRDVIGRLARREFPVVDQEMAYRFRDVYDQFVRIADDAMIFQDRVTGILDAHLASVSNRLAQVSKLLAIIATLFGPLTVVTGVFGMNVQLPSMPGGPEAQFWWVMLAMAGSCAALFAWFRRAGWW